MDTHSDIHWAGDDTSQNTLAERFTTSHEHAPGSTTLNEDSVPDDLSLPPSNVHSSLVTDDGVIKARKGPSPIHSFKLDQKPSDTQGARNGIDHENSCTAPPSNSDQVILPISKEFPPERAVVPAGESTPVTSVNDSEADAIVYPEEPSLLRARTASATAPHDEGEPDFRDRLNCIQMLHIEPDHVGSAGLAPLTDEEIREDFDYPCGDIPSSLPPSSSPPQLFSSSPCRSSQSSDSDVEPSKMVLAFEAETSAGSHDSPHGDHVVSPAQDESRLESKNLHSLDITDVATSPEIDACSSDTDPTSCVDRGLGPFKKQMTSQSDPDDSCGSHPIKRPKLDPSHYLPPAPKRATLASQHRQFKKLAAPFRPPLKLPVVADGLAQTRIEAEPTIRSKIDMSQDKSDPREPTTHPFPLQQKASNTPRSITQFKSPLVNRVLPADTRTIRLTPAVQALERKLQLLKRAVKVKEDKEEEVLVRLAGKWIEAGREAAYDVWDATKDAGDFDGKATFVRKSYGWESTDNGNVPWGWDTKPGDAGEESRDPDLSEVPYAAGRLTAEEDDDDVGCNTLGTMLRQLGIAPEIFGWDDDKEAFYD